MLKNNIGMFFSIIMIQHFLIYVKKKLPKKWKKELQVLGKIFE